MVLPDIQRDKRQYERCILRTKATILLPKGLAIEVPTIDISVGGVGIIANANPPLGASFGIRLPLMLKPTGLVLIETQVIVMHSVLAGAAGGFKVGLQFVELSVSFKSAIDAFVQQGGNMAPMRK